MNKWVKESIKLVRGDYYLDRLMEIYPPEYISRGALDTKIIQNLRQFYEERKCKELIYEIIQLMDKKFKFPIDHPYIGFLLYDRKAIDRNPETTKQICKILFKMKFNEIKQRLEAPKSASRRIGPMFRNWIRNNFKILDINDFEKSTDFAFLNGSDKTLKKYAKENLGCKFQELAKGLDFVARYRRQFIIGTAKFITRSGGSQTNQFYEALRLIKETVSSSNVLRIAVIDGIAWLDHTMLKRLKTIGQNEYALSGLLLKQFINEVIKTK